MYACMVRSKIQKEARTCTYEQTHKKLLNIHLFLFILLTHKRSHREVYQDFQPSCDIFCRSGVEGYLGLQVPCTPCLHCPIANFASTQSQQQYGGMDCGLDWKIRLQNVDDVMLDFIPRTQAVLTQQICRLSKNFLPYPCKSKSKEILTLSRSQVKRLIEIITGQNNLNYVQSKIHPDQISELCRFCEEEDETIAHLLNECPCFLTQRREILFNKQIIKTLKWKAKILLKFLYIGATDEAQAVDRQWTWNFYAFTRPGTTMLLYIWGCRSPLAA